MLRDDALVEVYSLKFLGISAVGLSERGSHEVRLPNADHFHNTRSTRTVPRTVGVARRVRPSVYGRCADRT